jgi:16S rRNA (cytosine967-C5)-methyltransferase
MTPAARFSAAIEVFADIDRRRRPAADALKDWGLLHRFAGSSDRASIASLVYDALRRRSSARWLMEDDGARATLLGMMMLQRNWTVDAIASLCSGGRFAPEPLSARERAALEARRLTEAPPQIQADVPDWLWSSFEATFETEAIAEGQALAGRAPLDIRVNLLKATRDKLLAELKDLDPSATVHSPLGIRIQPRTDGRGAAVQAEPSFHKGWFEVQDEGSQIAALLACAKPGEQVLDLCAGAGGKTLELAAAMGNKGQIYATDADKRRLMPMYQRLSRAGVRNVQVRPPRREAIDDLEGRLDLVLVDAPCSGCGTWRRNPDAKWRVRPNSLAERLKQQAELLSQGAAAVRPGGRLVYMTCSVLPDENDGAIEAFLRRGEAFKSIPPAQMAAAAGLPALALHLSPLGRGLQLTPLRTATDGFFIAMLERDG